jgi:hypothetical protein
MVVAVVALVVALGGTAIAANTIRSGDIVNGQVKTADLADGAVDSAKVKDRSLDGKDLHIRSIGTAEQAVVPAIDAHMSPNFVVHDDTPTPVVFDNWTFNTANMRDPHDANYLIAPVPGIYHATFHVDWAGYNGTSLPAGTDCTIQLLRGTLADYDVLASAKGDCSGGRTVEVNRTIEMGPADPKTIFALISQNSGSDFNFDVSGTHPMYADIVWVGPAQ